MKTIYCIKSGDLIKIGYTKSIRWRLHAMRLSNPHELTVVHRRRVEDDEVRLIEMAIHAALAEEGLGVGREWFRIDVPLAKAIVAVCTRRVREQMALERAETEKWLAARKAKDNKEAVARAIAQLQAD